MPVYRAYQEPGDFILTFPRAYHGGFGNGYNLGEAVNFGLRDWFPYGVDCQKRHRSLQRQNIVNLQELLMSEVLHLQSKSVFFGHYFSLRTSHNAYQSRNTPGSHQTMHAFFSSPAALYIPSHLLYFIFCRTNVGLTYLHNFEAAKHCFHCFVFMRGHRLYTLFRHPKQEVKRHVTWGILRIHTHHPPQ